MSLLARSVIASESYRLLLRGFRRSSGRVSGRSSSGISRGSGGIGSRSSGGVSSGSRRSGGISGRSSGISRGGGGVSSRSFRFLLGAASDGKGRNGGSESNVQFHVGVPQIF